MQLGRVSVSVSGTGAAELGAKQTLCRRDQQLLTNELTNSSLCYSLASLLPPPLQLPTKLTGTTGQANN